MDEFKYSPELLEELAANPGLNKKTRNALLKKAEELRSSMDQ